MHSPSSQNSAFVPAVGQIVRLKSGGPDMTVTHIDGDAVHVKWDGCEGQNTTFNTWVLSPVTPER